MNLYFLKNGSESASLSTDKPPNRFYSVEFAINEPKILYQFKIRVSPSRSMFIIVREDSDFLLRFKPGSVFKTRYYSTDRLCPTIDLETQIKEIIRDDKGRFKGHYQIGLDILSGEA